MFDLVTAESNPADDESLVLHIVQCCKCHRQAVEMATGICFSLKNSLMSKVKTLYRASETLEFQEWFHSIDVQSQSGQAKVKA